MTTVPQTFSPSQINAYVKLRLEHDEIVQDLWILGEITQFKRYNLGGQVYFYLNDGESQINCVMYDRFLENLPFQPENGQLVAVRGSIKVFHRKGTYCFQAVFMKLGGDGLVNQELEKLKAKLFQEGLFEAHHKKQIPSFPKRVAVITAWDSAAMWDVVSVVRSHVTGMHLCIVESVMQGADSPRSVKEALKKCQAYGQFDVIVLARGGGSTQDLSCFNDESLVRAIFACDIPIITAIGHEVDMSLCDLVSDLRCPTPTAAAKVLCEPYDQAQLAVKRALTRLQTLIQTKLSNLRGQAENLFDDMGVSVQETFDTLLEKTDLIKHRLELANPLHKLGQGFSITARLSDRKTLRSVEDFSAGDTILTYVCDGMVTSEVKTLQKKEWHDTQH